MGYRCQKKSMDKLQWRKREEVVERVTQRAERKKEEEEGKGKGVRGGAPATFFKGAF